MDLKILPVGQSPAVVTAQRATHVGMVFQFPERHFLGETLFEVCATAQAM